MAYRVLDDGPEPSGTRTFLLGAAARVYWFFGGNCVLYVTALAMRHQREGTCALDLLFSATVARVLLVRYLDIQRLGRTTASGEPASIHHWRRYSATILLVSAALWGISHAGARMAIWSAG